MPEPAVGDLRPPSVSQHIILHALHTGVLSHFRAVRRLVILYFCKTQAQLTDQTLQTLNWAASKPHPSLQPLVCTSICHFQNLVWWYMKILRWRRKGKTGRLSVTGGWVNLTRKCKSILVWGHYTPKPLSLNFHPSFEPCALAPIMLTVGKNCFYEALAGGKMPTLALKWRSCLKTNKSASANKPLFATAEQRTPK